MIRGKEKEAFEVEMTFCYGGDGTTGQSQYHMKSSTGETFDDHSLFVTSFNPLLITTVDKTRTIFKNPRPQSSRFNRTLSLEFIKETNETVTKIFDDIRKQIKDIENYRYIIDGTPIFVNFNFFETMIDGKVQKNFDRQ